MGQEPERQVAAKAKNINGRRKPSGDHLPGWVGCCRSVVRTACVSLDDPAIQRFRQNPQLKDEYHAPRKSVNCNWTVDGIFCEESRFCIRTVRLRQRTLLQTHWALTE